MAPDRFALLIDAGRSCGQTFLHGTSNDCLAMAEKLKKTYNFNPSDITIFSNGIDLADGIEYGIQNCNFDTVTNELKSLFRKLQPCDIAVVYFSGHGSLSPREHGLILGDGHCLPGFYLTGLARSVHPSVKLTFIFDASFGGGLIDLRESVATHYDPENPAPIVSSYLPSSFVNIASSRMDEPSYEGSFSGNAHGIFTRALLDSLAAKNLPLILDISDKMRNTIEYSSSQRPVYIVQSRSTTCIAFVIL